MQKPNSQPDKENPPETHENTNPSSGSRSGRERTYPNDDALESGLISMSNTTVKFLEAEQENAKNINGLQWPFMQGAEVHEQKHQPIEPNYLISSKILKISVLKKLLLLYVSLGVMLERQNFSSSCVMITKWCLFARSLRWPKNKWMSRFRSLHSSFDF